MRLRGRGRPALPCARSARTGERNGIVWATDADRDSGDRTLVVIGHEGQELGLVVDDLLGEEDLVIKSMAENYRNVAGISGASILGNGRVSLILDTTTLIGMANSTAKNNNLSGA